MSSLPDILTSPERRPGAVQALTELVEGEVRRTSGLGGMALRAGFSAATSLRPGLVAHAIDRLIPEFAGQLDPYWQRRGAQPFGPYLQAQGDAVPDALLTVADDRLANPQHAALARIYAALRPRAHAQVSAALPRLGATIETLAR